MKKVLALVAAAIIACPATINAQDVTVHGGVRFGLKLSPNMGIVKSETKGLEDNGTGLGYTFGLMTEFPIGSNGNYRFATGLNLNNLTGKWKESYSYYDVGGTTLKSRDLETDVKLQYIELPLTIKLMTNEIGYMRYFAVVGAGNAFNIRAKSDQVVPTPVGTLNGEPIVSEFTELSDEDIQKSIALYKASLIVGAGAEYNFSGGTSLLLGLTYNNGFTNILDYKISDGSGGEKKAEAKAHYFELTLGVYF